MYFQYDSNNFGDNNAELASLANKARRLVMDYYGTAMQSGMFAAGADLTAVQHISDTQIVAEARMLGLL
jgi:hypothetical protein